MRDCGLPHEEALAAEVQRSSRLTPRPARLGEDVPCRPFGRGLHAGRRAGPRRPLPAPQKALHATHVTLLPRGGVKASRLFREMIAIEGHIVGGRPVCALRGTQRLLASAAPKHGRTGVARVSAAERIATGAGPSRTRWWARTRPRQGSSRGSDHACGVAGGLDGILGRACKVCPKTGVHVYETGRPSQRRPAHARAPAPGVKFQSAASQRSAEVPPADPRARSDASAQDAPDESSARRLLTTSPDLVLPSGHTARGPLFPTRRRARRRR
jgi:hypothetical protein